MTYTKQWGPAGEDLIEVVIPPQDPEVEGEYTIQVHLSFMLSNWTCLFGKGCPGLFGKQSSVYQDDMGCCTDSFFFSNEEDKANVQAQIALLTDEDWDVELQDEVRRNGWTEQSHGAYGKEEKGRVFEDGCVFSNRNGGSTGKPGCAFVHKAARTGEDHIDVMPEVCWMLPLRFGEMSDNVWRLGPWDHSEWDTSDPFKFRDRSDHACWWCVDSPEPYVGTEPVFKAMEREIRAVIGDHAYECIEEAIRLRAGNYVAPMPGSVLNGGRPLLPLIVSHRTPAREPSYLPNFIKGIKQ